MIPKTIEGNDDQIYRTKALRRPKSILQSPLMQERLQDRGVVMTDKK